MTNWSKSLSAGPLELLIWQEFSIGAKLAVDSFCLSLSVNPAVVSFGVTVCWK